MMCAVCMFDGRRQADQIEQLQADLAAARALLRRASPLLCDYPEAKAAIDAALAKDKP